MTEKQTHTPGPWTLGAEHGTTEKLFHVWRHGDKPLSDWVATVFDDGCVSALEADARLIAQAPAMLEALYRAQEALGEYACHIGDKHPCIRTKDQCRNECGRVAGDAALLIEAVIAAATGEAP